MSSIEQIQVVPTPDGYELEIKMSDGVEVAFMFADAKQMVAFADDLAEVALLSVHFEKLEVYPQDLQEGDIFPYLGAVSVTSGPTFMERYPESDRGDYYFVQAGDQEMFLEPSIKIDIIRRIS